MPTNTRNGNGRLHHNRIIQRAGEQPPPHNADAERAVLGCLLIDSGTWPAVSEIIGASDFYSDAYRQLFQVIGALRSKGIPGDALTVAEELDRRGCYQEIGGALAINEILEAVPHAAHAEHYARIVRHKADRRRTIYQAREVEGLAADPSTDPETLAEALDSLQNSIRAAIDPIGARIEFSPVQASELGDGEAVNWAWKGWLARGHITLLVGLWKAGKSTLLGHLLRAAETGGEIAGSVTPGRWLVVSEEGAGLWARRRDEIGIGDHTSYIIRPFKARPEAGEWRQLIEGITRDVRSGRFDVVVIDTWANLGPVEKPNDDADQIKALMPLHHLTEAGAAVLLMHHPRKGDGTEGQASRGSGALPAFVDTICEFRRYDNLRLDDTRRTLRGLSRFEETPREVVIELTEDGYRACGSPSEAKQQDRQQTILSILGEADQPLTVDGVRDAWPTDRPPSKRAIQQDLESGHKDDLWDRSGKGRKGDPFRYGDDPTAELFDGLPENEEVEA